MGGEGKRGGGDLVRRFKGGYGGGFSGFEQGGGASPPLLTAYSSLKGIGTERRKKGSLSLSLRPLPPHPTFPPLSLLSSHLLFRRGSARKEGHLVPKREEGIGNRGYPLCLSRPI